MASTKKTFVTKNRPAAFGLLKKAKAHLWQSYYSFDYIKSHGISDKNIFRLSDYLNDAYLEKASHIDLSQKENIILYNPKKGKKVTQKILARFSQFQFIPLINKTNNEVEDLMRKAKLYIDFGSHPGKDRMPREAAMLHCCIITNRCGSAAYDEDVPILSSYKYNDFHLNYKLLEKQIQKCFSDYAKCDSDFDNYRKMIQGEKQQFLEDENCFKTF